MKLDDYRTSDNVGDERDQNYGGGGGGFGGGGGLFPLLFGFVASRFGIGGIVVLIIGALIFGGNPMALMGGGQNALPTGNQPTISHDGAAKACAANAASKFSCQVLASTEDTWSAIFQQEGRQYTPTALIFYSREGSSGCGAAQSAMGPFYCPNDKRVYLDTEFYDELQNKFGVSGNFAQAYVIAHEVGHHVQDELGTLAQATAQQRDESTKQGNATQVLIELQADCYAGVWAAHNRDRIEPGDVEGGLKAAHAIGDDTLQQEAQGRVVPDSFTHGTSAERMKWLKRGIDSGDPAQCDTFKVGADG
ncbi:KPN_02809 family neutral zinc metallopeptidase [Sphingomonas abietis]|uniref:Zinc metallopeptidase n=1 Tax=Sphingomonas abietis TaxID=3012344 RepID=A0ABY7NN54_9SPHN|nr:neutral zinc metallopeptidase [Sphingomonas abietis]WBO21916.1 zinc metallopeptidase [Sphingomonas abietis]